MAPVFSNKFKRKFKKLLRGILPLTFVVLVAIGAVVLHTKLYFSKFGQGLDAFQADVWFRIRGIEAPPSEVALVILDERTYSELSLSHLSPVPRAVLAEVVDRIAEAGASLAILDLFFRDVGSDPEGNRKLADSLGRMPTFIGSFRFSERSESGDPGQVIEVSPIAEFAQRAERVALMNLIEQGEVRRFTMQKTSPKGSEPLPVAYALREPKKPMPAQYDFINYYGPDGTIPRTSAVRVLRDSLEQNSARFKGKVVLIGSALPVGAGLATKDSFRTPMGTRLFPGVEVHATVVGNILRGEWIRRLPVSVEFPILNVVVVVLALIILRLSPLSALVCTAVGILAWSITSYVLFRLRWFVPGVPAFYIVLPCALLVSIVSKHTALKMRYQEFQQLLGAENRPQ